jgi:hypothetical protein
MDAQYVCFLTNNHLLGQRQSKRSRGRYRGRSRNRDGKSRSDAESDCDPDTDSDNAVQAALSGSQPKGPGFAGGYLLGKHVH